MTLKNRAWKMVNSPSLSLFIVATSIARAFRYFGLAWLVWKFGDSAEKLFRRHKIGASLVLAAIVAVVVVVNP